MIKLVFVGIWNNLQLERRTAMSRNNAVASILVTMVNLREGCKNLTSFVALWLRDMFVLDRQRVLNDSR